MLRTISFSQKTALRLLALGAAVAVLWAICQDLAIAQGVGTAALERSPPADDEGFFGNLFRSIFLFDSDGLMKTLSKPHYAIPAFIVLNLIIFTETGLLIGFFLPGDSLLVITGLICARDDCGWNIPLLLVSLSLSAIIGDTVGYWIGFKTGPKIFNREKSIFFAKDHLDKAQAFYEKRGGITIILARFVPFLRTFAPVVAGVGKMNYPQFVAFNVIGGVGWIFSMVLAGYFLPSLLNKKLEFLFGEGFKVEQHIGKIVIIIVVLSVTPMLFAWVKSKLSRTDESVKPEETHRQEVVLGAK